MYKLQLGRVQYWSETWTTICMWTTTVFLIKVSKEKQNTVYTYNHKLSLREKIRYRNRKVKQLITFEIIGDFMNISIGTSPYHVTEHGSSGKMSCTWTVEQIYSGTGNLWLGWYIPSTPAQGTGQVIACTEREHSYCRRRVEVELVKYRQHPADCSITSTCQHPQISHFAKHIQSATHERNCNGQKK